MILVCPSCQSKFNVPDGAIPPEGRKVRCAQCKNSWHATSANALKQSARSVSAAPTPRYAAPPPVSPPPLDAGSAAKAAAIRRAVIEEEAPSAHDIDDDPFDEGRADQPIVRGTEVSISQNFDAEAEGDDDLAHDVDDDAFEDEGENGEDDILARRRGDLRRTEERKSLARKRQIITVGWAALLLFWLGLLFMFVFMQDTVTSLFPGANQLYSSVSGTDYADRFRPAEGEKLTPPITETEVYVSAKLHGNLTRVETVDGKQQLVIRGVIENTGNRAANVPLVEITVKNERGAVIEQWNYAPLGLVLRRRSKLEFETMLYPVPAGAAVVEARSLEGTRSSNEAVSKQ